MHAYMCWFEDVSPRGRGAAIVLLSYKREKGTFVCAVPPNRTGRRRAVLRHLCRVEPPETPVCSNRRDYIELPVYLSRFYRDERIIGRPSKSGDISLSLFN